jgi:hypothetical protein
MFGRFIGMGGGFERGPIGRRPSDDEIAPLGFRFAVLVLFPVGHPATLPVRGDRCNAAIASLAEVG